MSRWLGGVRLRTAIAEAVVVGVAGVIAAFGFVRATESILTHNVDGAVRQRVAEVKAGLRGDEASDVLEALTGNATLVQVLDGAGHSSASARLRVTRSQPPIRVCRSRFTTAPTMRPVT